MELDKYLKNHLTEYQISLLKELRKEKAKDIPDTAYVNDINKRLAEENEKKKANPGMSRRRSTPNTKQVVVEDHDEEEEAMTPAAVVRHQGGEETEADRLAKDKYNKSRAKLRSILEEYRLEDEARRLQKAAKTRAHREDVVNRIREKRRSQAEKEAMARRLAETDGKDWALRRPRSDDHFNQDQTQKSFISWGGASKKMRKKVSKRRKKTKRVAVRRNHKTHKRTLR